MRHTMTAMAVAGLAASVWGQGVTLHFDADTTLYAVGDIITWTVSASFTGFDDPSAYFGGFVGSFLAYAPSYGEIASTTNLMSFEGTVPTSNGGDIHDINIFNSALLGTDDPSNPIDIFEFDVLTTDAPFGIGISPTYDAEGTVSVFSDDGIFTLPVEFTEFDVISDGVPAPGVVAISAMGGVLASRRRR